MYEVRRGCFIFAQKATLLSQDLYGKFILSSRTERLSLSYTKFQSVVALPFYIVGLFPSTVRLSMHQVANSGSICFRFKLLASCTVREYISVVFSHPPGLWQRVMLMQ